MRLMIGVAVLGVIIYQFLKNTEKDLGDWLRLIGALLFGYGLLYPDLNDIVMVFLFLIMGLSVGIIGNQWKIHKLDLNDKKLQTFKIYRGLGIFSLVFFIYMLILELL